MRILRFIVTWAFSTNEKVWKLPVSTRALSCQRRRTVKSAFCRRHFFLLQFKVFFLSGSTRSIPNVGKWCFSQFKFRFACVASPFRVSEQVGSVTFDHALILVRFNSKTSGCFCVHLALKSTTSAKSLHDKQLHCNQTITWSLDSEAAPWKYCTCVVLVFVVLYCYSFSFFRFKTYLLPMWKVF